MFFAAGQAAGVGAVPASVAALTRRVVILMLLNRLTLSLGGVVVLAAASIGILSSARGTSADPPVTKAQRARATNGEALGRDKTQVRPEPVLEEALRMADQITVPWMKAQALADIAAAQARLGQAESARATFRRAAEIIEGLGDDAFSRTANLSWLAKAQATAGDRDGARATIAQVLEWAPKIDNVDKRQTLLQIAATREAKAGDPQGALHLVRALSDAPLFVRAFVLAEIAGEQAKAEDLRGARATMARADADAERAEKEPPPEGAGSLRSLDAMRLAQVRGLAPLAEAEAKAGQIDAARATLRRARTIATRIGEESRPTPLAEIAMAQRIAWDRKTADATLSLALKVAEGLDTPDRRIEALARVAIVLANSGDRTAARETLDKALQIARAVPGNGYLTQQVVSGARARVGDWEGGRQAALSLNDEILRAHHIEDLTFEQAKAGETRNALEWAEAQTAALLRAHALLGVVRGIIDRKVQTSGK
jgi:tetratricopeptide (TPR) repeat protein